MSKVLTIVGPTASGKSDAGIRLAKLFNGEIINGDSIQVYRQLNIGSAKIKEEEMDGVVHHLLSYVDVGEQYNVKRFQDDARGKIREIEERGHLPIVVGGTGLYIKALLYDYDFVDNPEKLEQYEEEDTNSLYEKLKKIDPSSLEKIHPNNRKRIVRALQIAQSGYLKSQQEEKQKHEMVYDSYVLGLTMEREVLKQRIDLRVDKMFEEGLLEEVTHLNEDYSWSDHGLHGIGYKEFKGYFEGNQSLEETKTLIKTHTRQFAKRQYTWWNHQMDVHWHNVLEEGYSKMEENVRRWLSE